MKKFTLLALTAAFALTATAQRAVQPQTSLQKVFGETQANAKVMNMRQSANAGRPLGAKKVEPFRHAAKTTATRAADDFELITEVPEGRVETYTVSGIAYYNSLFGVAASSFVGNIGEVVFCDDNTVYIKNPISQFATGTYLKGTIEGDEITIPTHQPIYQENYEGEIYNYYIERVVYKEDESGAWYYIDDASSEIKFALRNDTLVMDEDPDGDVLLGFCDDLGDWMGYGDYATVYAPMTDKPVDAPADLALEDWTVRYAGDGHKVKVGFSGSDVYVGGLSEMMPDAWIKGTVDGGKVVIPSGQYLGPLADYNCHVYLLTAGTKVVWDDYYERYVTDYYTTDQIELTYDADAKTMTADSENDSTMFINSGKERVYYLEEISAPEFRYYTPVKGAAKPATPEFSYFMAYDESYGMGYFDVLVPKFDVDGNMLDTDKLHYNIFVDDELFTFYPDEYTYLTEEMTDVPYDFTDDYDILIDGAVKEIYYYFTGFEKIGVRSTYTSEDGVATDSDIAWYYVNGEPTGIGTAAAEGGDVKSVTYTDLSGRRIMKPAHGLYIKTETYADGTQKSVKMLAR